MELEALLALLAPEAGLPALAAAEAGLPAFLAAHARPGLLPGHLAVAGLQNAVLPPVTLDLLVLLRALPTLQMRDSEFHPWFS